MKQTLKSQSSAVIAIALAVSACVSSPPSSFDDVGTGGDDGGESTVDAGNNGAVDTGDGTDGGSTADMPGADQGVDLPLPQFVEPHASTYTATPLRSAMLLRSISPHEDITAVAWFLSIGHEIAARQANVTVDTYADGDFNLWVLGPTSAMSTTNGWTAGVAGSAKPVVSFDRQNWDELEVAGSYGRTTQRDVYFEGATAPLPDFPSAGLLPAYQINDGELVHAATFGPGVSIAGRLAQQAADAVIFGYEQGAIMMDSVAAPGRRGVIGFEDAADLSNIGWRAVGDIFAWATESQAPQATHICRFILANSDVRDFALTERFRRMGCEPRIEDAYDPQPVSQRAEVWVVGPAVDSVSSEMRDATVPIVVLTSDDDVHKDLGLIDDSVTSGSSNAAEWTFSSDAPEALRADLSASVAMTEEALDYTTHQPADLPIGALPVALANDGVVYWVVAAGGGIVDGTAAAGPRAVIGLRNQLYRSVRTRAVVDAVAQWAFAYDQ